MSTTHDRESPRLDRKKVLAAAAAGLAGAALGEDARAGVTRTDGPVVGVVGTYSDPAGLKLKKQPMDGFNRALVAALGQLPLKSGTKGLKVKIEFSAHAVYSRDPGAFDEYAVTLTVVP
jgi:hypothetical protein